MSLSTQSTIILKCHFKGRDESTTCRESRPFLIYKKVSGSLDSIPYIFTETGVAFEQDGIVIPA